MRCCNSYTSENVRWSCGVTFLNKRNQKPPETGWKRTAYDSPCRIEPCPGPWGVEHGLNLTQYFCVNFPTTVATRCYSTCVVNMMTWKLSIDICPQLGSLLTNSFDESEIGCPLLLLTVIDCLQKTWLLATCGGISVLKTSWQTDQCIFLLSTHSKISMAVLLELGKSLCQVSSKIHHESTKDPRLHVLWKAGAETVGGYPWGHNWSSVLYSLTALHRLAESYLI